MSVYGERLFGRVHRTPGLFYVATMFWHINFVPLVPVRSYVVLEGSEKDEGFQGARIPLSFKSVLAGYLRGWLGAAAIFTGCVGAFAATSFYVGVQGAGVLAVFAVAAAMFGVFWFIFNTRTWWFLPVQLALLLGSAWVYLDVRSRVPEPARGVADRRRHDASYMDTLLVGNAAAVLYSLTRLLTPASYRRAVELGRLAGIPPERVAEHFVRRDGAAPEEPAG